MAADTSGLPECQGDMGQGVAPGGHAGQPAVVPAGRRAAETAACRWEAGCMVVWRLLCFAAQLEITRHTKARLWLQCIANDALNLAKHASRCGRSGARAVKQKPRQQARALPRLLAGARASRRAATGSRMLVVARAEEDVSWLSIYLPDIPHTVYQVKHIADASYCARRFMCGIL